MAAMTLSADWHVEPEDTSVGIFGQAIYHEICPLADEAPEATEEISSSRVVGDTVYVVHTVTCPCGATASYTDTDYIGTPEDDDFGKEGWPVGEPIDYDREH